MGQKLWGNDLNNHTKCWFGAYKNDWKKMKSWKNDCKVINLRNEKYGKFKKKWKGEKMTKIEMN